MKHSRLPDEGQRFAVYPKGPGSSKGKGCVSNRIICIIWTFWSGLRSYFEVKFGFNDIIRLMLYAIIRNCQICRKSLVCKDLRHIMNLTGNNI